MTYLQKKLRNWTHYMHTKFCKQLLGVRLSTSNKKF